MLSVESSQGHNESISEIASLSNIKHENLVKLHGGCVDGPHKILVYDYMENNSLSQTLLGIYIYTYFKIFIFKERQRLDSFSFTFMRDICISHMRF